MNQRPSGTMKLLLGEKVVVLPLGHVSRKAADLVGGHEFRVVALLIAQSEDAALVGRRKADLVGRRVRPVLPLAGDLGLVARSKTLHGVSLH